MLSYRELTTFELSSILLKALRFWNALLNKQWLNHALDLPKSISLISLSFSTYNHIYPVGSSIPSNDHIDVNRLMRYFDEVFSKREMRGQGNVVVLNVGLHLIRATGLRTALEIIDLYVTKATQHNARVIWRGQTSIGEKTKARLFIRSFQTNIVSIQYFDQC